MGGYTQVSNNILSDLLNCKSKLTDVIQWAEDYEDVLREALLLDELMAILNSTPYTGEKKE